MVLQREDGMLRTWIAYNEKYKGRDIPSIPDQNLSERCRNGSRKTFYTYPHRQCHIAQPHHHGTADALPH